jgi:arginyl-tRNA synthetase
MEIVLRNIIKEAVRVLYNSEVPEDLIQIQETRKEFRGDFTLVVFPLLRYSKNTPENTGTSIGNFLQEHLPAVSGSMNQGFLNIEISTMWVITLLRLPAKGPLCKVPVALPEQSSLNISPNTNKPFTGTYKKQPPGIFAFQILSSCGHRVIKTNKVNDRGIHICKSMLHGISIGGEL